MGAAVRRMQSSSWGTLTDAAADRIMNDLIPASPATREMSMTTTTIPHEVTPRLRRIVGNENVLSNHSELLVYECDGFTIEKNCPDIVVFPSTTQQVAEVVAICNEFKIPFLPRGAGTSLAGGCLPIGGGVMPAPWREGTPFTCPRCARPLRVEPERGVVGNIREGGTAGLPACIWPCRGVWCWLDCEASGVLTPRCRLP